MIKSFKISADKYNAKARFTKWWAEIGLCVDYDKEYLFPRLLNFKIEGGVTTFHFYIENITEWQEYSVQRFKTLGLHFRITVLNLTFNLRISPFIYWKEK